MLNHGSTYTCTDLLRHPLSINFLSYRRVSLQTLILANSPIRDWWTSIDHRPRIRSFENMQRKIFGDVTGPRWNYLCCIPYFYAPYWPKAYGGPEAQPECSKGPNDFACNRITSIEYPLHCRGPYKLMVSHCLGGFYQWLDVQNVISDGSDMSFNRLIKLIPTNNTCHP